MRHYWRWLFGSDIGFPVEDVALLSAADAVRFEARLKNAQHNGPWRCLSCLRTDRYGLALGDFCVDCIGSDEKSFVKGSATHVTCDVTCGHGHKMVIFGKAELKRLTKLRKIAAYKARCRRAPHPPARSHRPVACLSRSCPRPHRLAAQKMEAEHVSWLERTSVEGVLEPLAEAIRVSRNKLGSAHPAIERARKAGAGWARRPA